MKKIRSEDTPPETLILTFSAPRDRPSGFRETPRLAKEGLAIPEEGPMLAFEQSRMPALMALGCVSGVRVEWKTTTKPHCKGLHTNSLQRSK